MTTDFSILKLCFFDTAIADIYRAIRGGSLIGAFTQSMCAIDAMAYLCDALPGEGTRANFERWVQDWIVPLNGNCRPDVLYALRCGLVHTYGYADAMNRCGVRGFSYTHNHPERHWAQPRPDVYILNLDSHVAEVTVAAYTFFDKLKVNCAADSARARSVIDRAQKLIYVKSYIQVQVDPAGQVLILPVIRTQDRFAKMDAALASLDDQSQPQVDTIVDAIRKIYHKN